MAVFQTKKSFVDMDDFSTGFFEHQSITFLRDQFYAGLTPGSDFQFMLTGSRFKYDGFDLVGGIIRSIEVRISGQSSAFEITGLKLDGARFGTLVDNNDSVKLLALILKGGDAIHGGADDDVLTGMAGDDVIEGDSGRDFIGGAAGDDTIIGGTGADIIAGGRGSDTFVYKTPLDVRPIFSAHAEEIQDFSRRQGDVIDVSDLGVTDFIGKRPFSGNAGEARFDAGELQLDLDGNGFGEFVIEVNGSIVRASDLLI